MKRYAVSVIEFWSNQLETEIISAESMKEALKKHTMISSWQTFLADIPNPDVDIEEAKQYFFNCDMMMDIAEISE